MPTCFMASVSKIRPQVNVSATAVRPAWALALLALLAVSLPFELDNPLFSLGPFAVTNVELALGLVLLTAVWGRLRWGLRPYLPHRLWIWAAAFTVSLLLAAFLVPANQSNALKASLRLITGLALALFAIPVLVHAWADARRIAWVVLTGSLAAAAIGLVEYQQNRELLWLTPLRQQPTIAGAFIRLTGSYDYANQAAMFIEATLPILLATIWFFLRKPWRRFKKTAVLASLILLSLFYLQAGFLTASRASIAAIALVSLLMGGLLWFNSAGANKQMSVMWLGMTTAVILLTLVNTQFNSLFRLRLQTEGDNEWYRAALIAPQSWQMAANEQRAIPITLTNSGALTWRSSGSQPINLGARWLDTAQKTSYGEPRWPFANPVPPGQTVQMNVTLQAPAQPGEYVLIWDVVQEQVTWFGAKSNNYTVSRVTVIPGVHPPPAKTTIPTAAWEYRLPIPDRRTLWLTALTLWRERPFLGIGPDNFRLTYGRALGAANWNETIHSNNWYVETAVSLGIIGSLVVFSGMAWLGLDIIRTLRQKTVSIWQIAAAAGLLSFFIHGLLDFFLLFNATGLLFWLLLGLWLAMRRLPNDTQYATRNT
ncbi:MAG TPA: hypothetical protein ENJ93_02460 [Chloroflexi bacterium]|nr:hypothetical protein [Chloroflexota bacterium]